MINKMLKQLSNDVPTMSLQIANDTKLLQNAVPMEAKKPTALQETNAGIRP